MRVTLAQDPTVLSLGLSLGISAGIPPEFPRRARRRVAVALLLETWGLFHVEADATGLLPGYSLADVDEHVAVTGWGQAMVEVGWLSVSPAGVTAYAFDDWIGSKKANQSKDRERKRAKRPPSGGIPAESQRNSGGPSSSSSDSSSLSSSEGETEREAVPLGVLAKVAAKDLEGIPPGILTELDRWGIHRREIGKPLGASSMAKLLALARTDPAAFARRVDLSIANGTTVLLEERPAGTNGRPRPHSSQDAFRANLADLEQHLAEVFPDNPNAPRIAP
jgi:hypothetical protein